MKERVYSVDNYWDMTILQGVADFQGAPHYFDNIFSSEMDSWTQQYRLTPLSSEIFHLCQANWRYWLHWLKSSSASKVPHPLNYAKLRSVQKAAEISAGTLFHEAWEKAECNYRDRLIIDQYLKDHGPTILVKGNFSGQLDGTDTFVTWSEIQGLLLAEPKSTTGTGLLLQPKLTPSGL